MVKRPLGIKVSYLNHDGDEIEEELHNFKARVFLHMVDYLNGRTMTHWRLSEGNIDIIDGQKDNYKNLQSTIDFYKFKIEDMKKSFGDEMFKEDSRKHRTEEVGAKGEKCKLYGVLQ